MPYRIREGGQDCPFEVINEDTGERKGCHGSEDDAKKHLAALYANVPDAGQRERAPIEWRSAHMENIDFTERVIRVLAVPFEQRAKVVWEGEVWDEMFLRGSFDGIQTKQRFSVNRDHDKMRTVGRVVKYFPDHADGLVIDARISHTPLGDETLALAADDALSGSVGFAARRSDQILDRHRMVRSIKRAFLDHLAFVPDPAYEGAQVIGVRAADDGGVSFRAPTPAMDEVAADPVLRWAAERLGRDGRDR